MASPSTCQLPPSKSSFVCKTQVVVRMLLVVAGCSVAGAVVDTLLPRWQYCSGFLVRFRDRWCQKILWVSFKIISSSVVSQLDRSIRSNQELDTTHDVGTNGEVWLVLKETRAASSVDPARFLTFHWSSYQWRVRPIKPLINKASDLLSNMWREETLTAGQFVTT